MKGLKFNLLLYRIVASTRIRKNIQPGVNVPKQELPQV
jgi:hypothetical protein